MTSKVDELFGEEGQAVRANIRGIVATLALGVLLAFVGLVCTSVPGGLIVLWAWSLTEKEIDRVDSGYLPEDSLPALRVLKGFVWASLIVILIIFVGQTILLFSGFYVVFWGDLVQSFAPAAVPAS